MFRKVNQVNKVTEWTRWPSEPSDHILVSHFIIEKMALVSSANYCIFLPSNQEGQSIIVDIYGSPPLSSSLSPSHYNRRQQRITTPLIEKMFTVHLFYKNYITLFPALWLLWHRSERPWNILKWFFYSSSEKLYMWACEWSLGYSPFLPILSLVTLIKTILI